MKEVIGKVLLVLGLLILFGTIIYGAFLIHWFVGTFVVSLILTGLGAALVQDN